MQTNQELLLLPQELIENIGEYLDAPTLFQARLVNKLWYQIMLYKFSNAVVLPKKFSSQRLHHWLLDYQAHIPELVIANNALSSPFHPAHQEQFFQQYMKEVYQHVDSTPLEFLQTAKDQLLKPHPKIGVEDEEYNLLTREQLLDNWESYPQHIAILFDHVILHRLAKIFHVTDKSWHAKTNDDLTFIEILYESVHQLESLFSAYAILYKIGYKHRHSHSRNFFQNYSIKLWTEMLTVRDLLILDLGLERESVIITSAIEVLLDGPVRSSPPLVFPMYNGIDYRNALTLLKKFTPHTLAQYIESGLGHRNIIVKAIKQRQSLICGLLLQMTPQQLHQVCLRSTEFALKLFNYLELLPKISDETIIIIFNQSIEAALIPLLIKPHMLQRLNSSSFLTIFRSKDILWKKNLWQYSYDIQYNRSFFIRFLLSTPEIVQNLSISTIEAFFLIPNLPLNKIVFDNLLNFKKLQALNSATLITIFTTYSSYSWSFLLQDLSMVQQVCSKNFLKTFDQLALWNNDVQKRANFLDVFLVKINIIEQLSVSKIEKIFSSDYVNPNKIMLFALFLCKKLHLISHNILIYIFNFCLQKGETFLLTDNDMMKCLSSEDFSNANETHFNSAEHRQQFIQFLLNIPEIIQQLSLEVIYHYVFSYGVDLNKTIVNYLIQYKKLPWPLFLDLYHHAKNVFEPLIEVKDYAFELIQQPYLLAEVQQNLPEYMQPMIQLLSIVLQKPETENTACSLLEQTWFVGELPESILNSLQWRSSGANYELLQAERDRRVYETFKKRMEIIDQENLKEYLDAVSFPKKFPSWSLGLMIAVSMMAMACIVLASLSLGQVESATQTVAYLHQQLQLTFPIFYTEVGLLGLGIVIHLITLGSSILRKNIYELYSKKPHPNSFFSTFKPNKLKNMTQINLNEDLDAVNFSKQFPLWSLELMIAVSMMAMACIVLASLSLGQVESAIQAIDYLHQQLHLAWPPFYTEVSLLVLGSVLHLTILGASIFRKNTYTPSSSKPSPSSYAHTITMETDNSKDIIQPTQRLFYRFPQNSEEKSSFQPSSTPNLWEPATSLTDVENNDEFNLLLPVPLQPNF